MSLLQQVLLAIKTGLPLPTNGVAWYRAEDNTDDESGVYNATAGAGTGYTASSWTGTKAFSFSGSTNQRVLVPTINLGSAFSIEAHAYLAALGSGTFYNIVSNDYQSNANYGALYVQGPDPGLIRYYWNNADKISTASGMIAINNWYKFTIIYSSSKTKLYLNDLLAATETGTHTETYNNQLGIGYPSITTGSPGNTINGRIDDVILYNAAITPSVPGNLVAWFKGNNDVSDSGGYSWPATAGAGTAYDTASNGTDKAFKFNGNTNSAVTLNGGMPIGTGGYSITFDLYIDSGNTGFRDLIAHTWNNNAFFGDLYLNGGKLEYWNGSSKRVQGVTSLSNTTWYSVKLTYNASDSKSRLYIGGTLDATESGTHTETFNAPPKIGYAQSGGTAAFIGRIGNVKIYNAVV